MNQAKLIKQLRIPYVDGSLFVFELTPPHNVILWDANIGCEIASSNLYTSVACINGQPFGSTFFVYSCDIKGNPIRGQRITAEIPPEKLIKMALAFMNRESDGELDLNDGGLIDATV
jgi:hypothetical protein